MHIALAPGSYLALSHSTMDKLPPRMVQAGLALYERAADRLYPRSRAEVERFFDGLDLVPPYRGAAPVISYVGLWVRKIRRRPTTTDPGSRTAA